MEKLKKWFIRIIERLFGIRDERGTLHEDEKLNPDEQEEEEGEVDMSNVVVLERTYYKKGVHGTLTFPDGDTIETLERPWQDNERSVSCIPEGSYPLGYRESPLITRLHEGREGYTHGWEVQEVDNRSHIMFHIGNYVKNSDGCILIGARKDFQGQTPVVWSSREAYNEFVSLMQDQNIDTLVVKEINDEPYKITEKK